MKRRELIRELVDAGCYLNRHGKKHDISSIVAIEEKRIKFISALAAGNHKS